MSFIIPIEVELLILSTETKSKGFITCTVISSTAKWISGDRRINSMTEQALF